MSALADLFAQHAAASLDKQLCLCDVVGDLPWQADLDAGTITFGSRLTFPVQVLGTQADESGTWLWAWANGESGVPEPLLRASLALRQLGEKQGIPELVEPDEVALESFDGHYLAMIASGVCGADAYYRGPYEGGAAFLLIEGAEPVRAKADASAIHVNTVFTQVVSQFELDHQVALEAYLTYKGYIFTRASGGIVAQSPTGDELHARFDEMGRLAKFESTVGKGRQTPRPWWQVWGR